MYVMVHEPIITAYFINTSDQSLLTRTPSLQGNGSVETLPRQGIRIAVIMSGEEQNLWISSLCNFLQTAVTSSLFHPNFNTLSICIEGRTYQRTEHVERRCCN
jgi:hypothetical protein